MKLAVLVAAVTVATLAGDTPAAPTTRRAGGYACDMDGVTVDYAADHEGGSRYVVTTAHLSDVPPSCAGARASVSLYENVGAVGRIAAGSVLIPADGPRSVSVPLTPQNAQAERVNLVRVTIILAGNDVR